MCAWFLCLWAFSDVTAQQYDKVWAVGSYVTTMTFESDSISLGYLEDSTNFSFVTIGNICDSNGNFLFYSNGLAVYNKYGRIMPHGDSLSFPSEYYSLQVPQGMASNQGMVILPNPGNANQYYIFHYTGTDTLVNTGGYESTRLYYSVVDMEKDSGRGDLIKKNVPILQGIILSAGRISACRHANGRDWWIVKPAWQENIYYTFLLTPDSVKGPFTQRIGPSYGHYNEVNTYSTFSLDGTKYASVTEESLVVLMDFDRCTGLFSNPDSFYNSNSFDPVHNPMSGGNSLAFSPNGRFLYVVNPIELNQYDLWRSPIRDSVRIKTDSINDFQMNNLQYGPNGKIYLSCWNGGSYAIHVINQPDSLGMACDFQFLGQSVLSVNSVGIPYFPNFRLGALIGSGCDTIPNGIQNLKPIDLKIEPNPASNLVTISYPPHESDGWRIDLYDNLGELILSQNEKAGADRSIIDVSTFPIGLYFVRVYNNNTVMLNSKLIIAR